MDFNSRPHEEVDRQLRSIKCHRLHFNSRPREEVDISYCPRRAGLLLFQLTTSQGGRLIRSVNTANCLYFNSRPHEEVDRIRLFQTVESIISTHDLAKRSTRYLCRFSSSITFQLTTSRRGRRQFLRKKFSFPNYFLCLLHIIYSYYINTIFFSTLFFAKSSFFLVRIP